MAKQLAPRWELTNHCDCGSGYFKGEQILACMKLESPRSYRRQRPPVPKFDGRFDRADFIYDAQKNEYRCPAGQHLIGGTQVSRTA